ncbi:MAG TPA: RHS repeat-associated core domain-containing protein, partial [Gemmatimonadales bacterium]|nr:RHS repeat-associated core domain-containing protein [Gemmatimonadales bacterium]
SASNRLGIQRDSMVGTSGHTDRNFSYDAAGNRLRSALQFNDTTYWQYDVLGRLLGTVKKLPPPPVGGTVLPHLDECRWHPGGRLGQPCGGAGQLGFVGENVTRSSLGWFFVHAPGIDEALLLIHRYENGVIQQRLQAVTDGRGQLLAIADSQGYITATYAGSGYDQAAWRGAGLTSRAQTYEPRRWETDADWGGVQQFRHRAYDPGTGTWIQEDPLGVAGGVNVYQYNNGNPVTFSDPMGMCPTCALGAATGVVTGYLLAKATGAEYGLKEAATDAVLGAFGGGAAKMLRARSAAAAGASGSAALARGGVSNAIGRALEGAGTSFESRIEAVSRALPKGQDILMGWLDDGSRVLQGGTGSRLRQIILHPSGKSTIKAYDPASDAWTVIKEILP